MDPGCKSMSDSSNYRIVAVPLLSLTHLYCGSIKVGTASYFRSFLVIGSKKLLSAKWSPHTRVLLEVCSIRVLCIQLLPNAFLGIRKNETSRPSFLHFR